MKTVYIMKIFFLFFVSNNVNKFNLLKLNNDFFFNYNNILDYFKKIIYIFLPISYLYLFQLKKSITRKMFLVK